MSSLVNFLTCAGLEILILYRDLSLLDRFCQEISHRDLVERSCTEIYHKDLDEGTLYTQDLLHRTSAVVCRDPVKEISHKIF